MEKSLIIGKEVQQAKDQFENLEWQRCALKAHNTVIEHGKGGFLLHLKPLFSLKVGLDSNDLHEECSNFFVIITPCAFLWYEVPTCMGLLTSFLHAHVSLMVCCGTFFVFPSVGWRIAIKICIQIGGEVLGSQNQMRRWTIKVHRNKKIIINIMITRNFGFCNCYLATRIQLHGTHAIANFYSCIRQVAHDIQLHVKLHMQHVYMVLIYMFIHTYQSKCSCTLCATLLATTIQLIKIWHMFKNLITSLWTRVTIFFFVFEIKNSLD